MKCCGEGDSGRDIKESLKFSNLTFVDRALLMTSL